MFKRKSLIVFYEDQGAISALENLSVNIIYKSNRFKYAIIYFDEERTRQIVGTLKSNKKILEITESEVSLEHLFF